MRLWMAWLAATAVAVAAPSASAETVTFIEPFARPVANDCTGEMFSATGTTHIKSTGSVTLAGFKSEVEINLTGVQGTTPAGVRYVMNSQSFDMSHAEFDPDGNAQQTMEVTILMVRQG